MPPTTRDFPILHQDPVYPSDIQQLKRQLNGIKFFKSKLTLQDTSKSQLSFYKDYSLMEKLT